MNAINAKITADKVNYEHCKVILLMIDEAVNGGNYELMVSKDMLPDNKRIYLLHMGFSVYERDGRNAYKISW